MGRTFLVEVTDWTADYKNKRLFGKVVSDEEDLYERDDEISINFESTSETNDRIYFLTNTTHKTFMCRKSEERHRRRTT